MILLSVDHSPILDLSTVARVLVSLFGEAAVSAPRQERILPEIEGVIDVNPAGEPSFSVDLGVTRDGVAIDGTPEQNVRVVVALRAVIRRDASRIVVLEPDINAFVDIPVGVTAEQIAAGWRDFSEFDENEQGGSVSGGG